MPSTSSYSLQIFVFNKTATTPWVWGIRQATSLARTETVCFLCISSFSVFIIEDKWRGFHSGEAKFPPSSVGKHSDGLIDL